jgi:hypothetical protein
MAPVGALIAVDESHSGLCSNGSIQCAPDKALKSSQPADGSRFWFSGVFQKEKFHHFRQSA